jgi:predicted transcriptional regulator
MPFEIALKSGRPLTQSKDIEYILIEFLFQIGYLASKYENASHEEIKKVLPYRLVVDCFLRNPNKFWEIDQLAAVLKTTNATIYRHLNKLKVMDLIEETSFPGADERYTKKGYRVRFGELKTAWNFVETHLDIVKDNYRKTVDHLATLMKKQPEFFEKGVFEDPEE